MTKSTITREESVQAVFDLKVGYRLGFADIEILKRVARIALAAMDSEPVAYTDDELNAALQLHRLKVDGHSQLSDAFRAGFRYTRRTTAQSAVESDFIPKNLDKALGVLAMAIPESREEFNFQTERWIQRLIDRVIRYADEFQEQPAPAVPEEKPIPNTLSMYAVDAVAAIAEVKGWNACRTAMLQASNSPAQSDCFPAQNHVSPEQNSVDPAQSPIDHGYLPECECSGCKATARICAELAGNSQVIPDGYVMVPKEPTEAMMLHNSGCQHHAWDDPDCAMRQTRRLIWSHMLAAAQQEGK